MTIWVRIIAGFGNEHLRAACFTRVALSELRHRYLSSCCSRKYIAKQRSYFNTISRSSHCNVPSPPLTSSAPHTSHFIRFPGGFTVFTTYPSRRFYMNGLFLHIRVPRQVIGRILLHRSWGWWAQRGPGGLPPAGSRRTPRGVGRSRVIRNGRSARSTVERVTPRW